MMWRVEDGQSIKIWEDKWVLSPLTNAIQTPVSLLDRDAQVCELIDDSTRWWNIGLVEQIFSVEDSTRICSLPLCPNLQGDRFVWSGNKNGLFKVRSAYHMAKNSKGQDLGGLSNDNVMSTLWKKIWSIKWPRVVKMFLWKACNNILPTKENLYKRKVVADPLCVVCGRITETPGHVLWSCGAAKDVWMDCSSKLQKCTSDEEDFLSIFEKLLGKLEQMEIELVACVARQLWMRRNKVVFGDDLLPPSVVIRTAIDQMEAFHAAELRLSKGSLPPPVQKLTQRETGRLRGVSNAIGMRLLTRRGKNWGWE